MRFFLKLVNLSYHFKRNDYQNRRIGFPFKREICMIFEKSEGGIIAWVLAADFPGKLYLEKFRENRTEVRKQ